MHGIFLAMYISWMVTEVLVLVVTRTRKGGGAISDRGSLKVLWVVTFCSIGMGSWAEQAYAPGVLHGVEWMKSVAIVLMATGLVVRWTAIYTLGRAFSANVAIREEQKLNTSGLFRWMRHPSYTGMVLMFVAMALWSRNWLAMLFFLVGPMAALLYRIRVEEDALTGAFGAEYVEYSRTTKRLIPGVY
jgi:protein-S-isoprenylcysteine O-methyltransferase Ste14